ncbi:MAG: translation initiation factor [Rhodococcus sp.]|nr:translation initiation factor [Rhodococcus sp. (in: high G+C Gram-positive bacteria)]
MPPRRRSGATTQPNHLTADNLEALASAVALGKRATVYLREAVPGLGLPAGASAKVVSVQGNTVMISPKGVNDELPYEAEELQMSKPATPKAPAPKPKAAAPEPVVHQGIEPGPPPAPKPVPARAASSAAKSETAPTDSPKPTPRRTGAKRAPAGVSVTIHAGADNEWSVTVAHGAKKPGKAVPVAPDAVERAVRELGEETAIEAVDSIIVAARSKVAARVDELSKELEEARKLLEALGESV